MPRVDSLRRVLGSTTTLLIGLGVAIGSGIFRTPSLVAGEVGSPIWIIALWLVGGLVVTGSGLVSAELSTRFPQAGGEYVYLREAYGDLVAFFFGWGYTVFIIGGGLATIAAAFGEASAQLLGVGADAARWLGAAGLISVAAVNSGGVELGARFQNVLTLAKVLAIGGVSVLAWSFGEQTIDWSTPIIERPDRGALATLVLTLPLALWAYEGTTDSVKMAEEVKDVRRAMPRALVGAAAVLTCLYVAVNLACMHVLTPAEMGAVQFAPSEAMGRLFGDTGRRAMTIVALVVFLGSLSSTQFATVRVTFALARDGLAFRPMARMSERQSPVAAIAGVTAVALVFTLARDFAAILHIYFLAAAVLFGLTYASLLVFRARDRKAGEQPEMFRAPAGSLIAVLLILLQGAMALMIIVESPTDSIYTLGLLALFVVMYRLWPPRDRERST